LQIQRQEAAEEMISEAYRAEQEMLHRNPNYGVASTYYAPLVDQVLRLSGLTDLLDYGAGKQRLKGCLTQPCEYHAYDPSIPEIAGTPDPHDVVACIDVLEHIEPEYLDAVLDDLKRLTKKVGVFTVHTKPAVKVLSDGRNAHLTQQPADWWMPKFEERFRLRILQEMDNGFFVVLDAK
jgi:hypothetical protein